MVAAAVIGVGVLGAGASLASGAMQSSAAENAATTQSNAAMQQQANLLAVGKTASGQDLGAIKTASAYLLPYQQTGTTAANLLNAGLANGSLTQGFTPTQAALNAMPGYQFELQQGLEATQNGFAAKGLASSGAAIKGAGQYAQGLASTDLNNLANIYYTNQANQYNRLSQVAGMGAQVGNNLAQINSNLTQASSNALMGTATNVASLGMAGAQAQAAGTIGSANALSNGLTGAGNAAMQGALGYAILGQNSGGNSLVNANDPIFNPSLVSGGSGANMGMYSSNSYANSVPYFQ